MMSKIIVADSSERDAERFQSIIEKAGLAAQVCSSGAELADYLDGVVEDVVGVFLEWEIPGPPFGFELLVRSRHKFPEVPVVIVSSAFDASVAARADKLGAYDFLEKPLDPERVRACLQSLLRVSDPLSLLVENLKTRVIGDSLSLLSTLKQLARAIKNDADRVLLIGESGTGKELLATAFHDLGSRAEEPFVAVNVAAIPKDLIESVLFGHEKGAFTGADELHKGYLEESGQGTLFLDEMGDLELSLQVKLLRAIQEKKFRRLKGTQELDFRGRLVCATYLDLPQAVKKGTFRSDLFHRIAEFTVRIPPLRERDGDIDLLADHFLEKHRGDRTIRFARETRTVLRSYSYPTGNVRELENYIKNAVIECEDELILPKQLPLSTIAAFILSQTAEQGDETVNEPRELSRSHVPEAYQRLLDEVVTILPPNWRDLKYKKAMRDYKRAFDRIYLPRILAKYSHNLTQASKAAGIDKNTFTRYWREAGLPPLRGKGEPDE